jgi:hypothetical protein
MLDSLRLKVNVRNSRKGARAFARAPTERTNQFSFDECDVAM